MATFNLNIDYQQPMTETHYYKWMQQQELKDVHSVNTKLAYLKSLSFVVGVDMLVEKDLMALQYIEQHYFNVICKPLITKPKMLSVHG